MIEVRGIEKRFGVTRAVKNMSFAARDGSITGLLGANGAGKTTALKMICGLLKPDRGEIRIDGCERRKSVGGRGSLGALLDHTGLYGRLTARENLVYFAELQGFDSRAARGRADRALDSLGLESVANRRVAGFSLGQRAKVALGRAIIHSPRNVLLDEPTNGLDVPTVRALRMLLREMRDAGCCIVFSSHVLDEVEQLCDHIVVVSEGEVAGCGSLEEIRRLAGARSLEDAFVTLTEGQVNAHA